MPTDLIVTDTARCPLCGRRLAESSRIHKLRRRNSVSEPYREVVVCGRELPPLWLLASWPRRAQDAAVLAVWDRLESGEQRAESEGRGAEGEELNAPLFALPPSPSARPGMTTAAGAIVLVVGLSLTWAAVIALMVRTLIH